MRAAKAEVEVVGWSFDIHGRNFWRSASCRERNKRGKRQKLKPGGMGYIRD